MAAMISFACPDSSTGNGYLATASDAKGAIVVIQEWWGLNDQMKGIADRCAAVGYNALVPDLYDGRATHDPDEAGHMMEGLDWVGLPSRTFAVRPNTSKPWAGRSRSWVIVSVVH